MKSKIFSPVHSPELISNVRYNNDELASILFLLRDQTIRGSLDQRFVYSINSQGDPDVHLFIVSGPQS